jgi:hypothetical protein
MSELAGGLGHEVKRGTVTITAKINSHLWT